MESTKVIVVGDSGVGKTCIILRYVYDKFEEFNTPTVGASFVSKVHTFGINKTMRFQIWDTAGQERYKSIAPIYYRDSQTAICVYDITRRSSFQVMKNWIKILQNDAPEDILFAIVGNKIDIVDKQQVTYQQGKSFSEEIGAIFKLTSAKDNQGVNQLFTQIAQKMHQLNLKAKEKGITLEMKEQRTSSSRWNICCRSS